jgi:hypothetical protein
MVSVMAGAAGDSVVALTMPVSASRVRIRSPAAVSRPSASPETKVTAD